MDRPWFTEKAFSSLEIRKDASLADHTVVRSITISDTDYPATCRLDRADPANGDMMISFSGAAEYIVCSA